MFKQAIYILVLSLALLGYFMTNVEAETLSVKSSAYNLVAAQTSGNPNIGACGRITKGQNAIAVSRDLRKKLPCNSKVKIKGKVYTVRDTMAKRWRNKIDICFYKDIRAAKRYGVKSVKMEIM